MDKKSWKKLIKQGYTRLARRGGSCCGPGACACDGRKFDPGRPSRTVGYTPEDLAAVPAEANLGLGCGNPVALAELREGETVLDLGCGAGIDCFLAAGKVGPRGKVIGVDMTPAMVEKARRNAQRGGYLNVEFRLGEIEHLPIADGTVDVIISNCVINLSPEKEKVFREAFRVLRPGGRMALADLVWRIDPPAEIKESVAAHIACLGGAEKKETYLSLIRAAGFADVTVVEETPLPAEFLPREVNLPAGAVVSLKIAARKPDLSSGRDGTCACLSEGPSSTGGRDQSPTSRPAGFAERIRLIETIKIGLPLGARIFGFFFAFSYLGHLVNLAFPTRWIMDLFGAGRFHAVPLAAALGVPLYINAEVSLPVVRSLMNMGMSPGAALALVITGAGTSVGAIAGAFTIAKKRVVGLVVGSLWVGAIVAGYLYDLVVK